GVADVERASRGADLHTVPVKAHGGAIVGASHMLPGIKGQCTGGTEHFMPGAAIADVEAQLSVVAASQHVAGCVVTLRVGNVPAPGFSPPGRRVDPSLQRDLVAGYG